MICRFDEKEHKYYIDKKEVPGVNKILEGIGRKRTYTGDPIFGEIGTYTALAIKLFLDGTLDEGSLDEAIVPRFRAYQDFARHCVGKPILFEKALFSEDQMFAGTPDQVRQISGKNILIDYKCVTTLDHIGTDYQLCGYWRLCKENGIKIDRRASLRLGAKGEFDLVYYDFDADRLWDSVMTQWEHRKLKLRTNDTNIAKDRQVKIQAGNRDAHDTASSART